MNILKIITTIIFIALGVALSVIVLLQEGKSSGLGSLSGNTDTYWSKNKGRSAEGNLEKATKYIAIGFMLLAVVLNLPVFQ